MENGVELDEPFIKPSPFVIEPEPQQPLVLYTSRWPKRLWRLLLGVVVLPIAVVVTITCFPVYLVLRYARRGILRRVSAVIHDDIMSLPNAVTVYSCGCEWCSASEGIWIPCDECSEQGGRCWESEELWYPRNPPRSNDQPYCPPLATETSYEGSDGCKTVHVVSSTNA